MKSTIVLIAVGTALIAAPLQSQTKASGGKPQKPTITFVELGSVNCIPCRQMQPVMKSIEEKYAGQVKVVFYDVWKENQRRYAQEYKIRVIPTQVFLGQDGQELMRHEGFFPEKDIDAFLRSKGLNPKVGAKE